MHLPLSLIHCLLLRRLCFPENELSQNYWRIIKNENNSDEGTSPSSHLQQQQQQQKNGLQNMLKSIMLESLDEHLSQLTSTTTTLLQGLLQKSEPEVPQTSLDLFRQDLSIPLGIAAIATFAGTLVDTVILLLLVAKIIIALLVIIIVIIGIVLGIIELSLILLSKCFPFLLHT